MSLPYTAAELVKAISEGTVSSEESTKKYLENIKVSDLKIQAFNSVLEQRALEKAKHIDLTRKKGEKLPPLAGLPIAVKDNICTEFSNTTCSSKILENFIPPYNATVIELLEKAGAVIIGKTNMDEFAMGSSTENSAFKSTKNPWNTDYVPGGSSGGSAAAVASKECAAAIGSDTGGSIRQPAAFCGVVGLKPTYGRVSRYGLIAYGSSLDQIGTLTRDVRDSALIAGIISGYDEKDSTSINKPVPDYLSEIDKEPEDLTIGIPEEYFTDALDSRVNSKIREAIAALKNSGINFVDIKLPNSRIDIDSEGNISSYAVSCYYIIAMAEASSNLSRYDGVHYGYRTKRDCSDIIELYSRSRFEGFGEEVKRRIMLGTYALSSGYYDAYYLKALKVRRLIKNDFDEAFKKCDLVISPVTPGTAFKIGEDTDDPLSMYLEDIYTTSLNLSGLPGLSLPCGTADNGLPVGMQFIGPVLSEELLFRAGRFYEKISGISCLNPPLNNMVE
jgi:aspartyl-tRNA(Asn)/glutamyl-tRNA(Gln) amidotransferase subunit A